MSPHKLEENEIYVVLSYCGNKMVLVLRYNFYLEISIFCFPSGLSVDVFQYFLVENTIHNSVFFPTSDIF